MLTRQSVVTKTMSKTKLVFYSLPPKYISSLKFPLLINISWSRYSVAPTKNLGVMLIPPLLSMPNRQFLSILIMKYLVALFSHFHHDLNVSVVTSSLCVLPHWLFYNWRVIF